jgi:hypothetical protein
MAGKASPDDTGRVLELATMGTPASAAARAGEMAIPGVAKAVSEKPAVVPTTAELARAGGADISAATKSDLRIPSQAVADYSRLVQQRIGVHPVDAEKTFAKLKELEQPPAGSFFTPADLQALRGSLQDTAQNFNPNAAKDQLAASRAIKEFDNFLRSLGPQDTMAGPVATGPATRDQIVAQALAGKREADRVAGLFERGRGNYAPAMRSNAINGELDRATTGVLERAEGRAQAANSGRNIDNTIRQKAESMLEKPKEVSGLNDAEVAALDRVVQGGAGRNTARYLGNVLGGGGGMGQALWGAGGAAAGTLAGGPIGGAIGAAAPTLAGATAKGIANILARRDLRAVDELMRKRSPLYKERVANPQTYVISPEKRAAMAKLMLLDAMNQQ